MVEEQAPLPEAAVGRRTAFGAPGIEPRWTRGAKDAIGTAYSASSCVWFTLAQGVVTEVYFPTLDRPQIRDLQFLVSDNQTFFHDERRNTTSQITALSDHSLGYRVHNTNVGYRIEKEIICDPHQDCLLVHTRFVTQPDSKPLRLYALCAPHLEVGGEGNSAEVVQVAGQRMFLTHKGARWMALGASVPFLKMSCGYVGRSDGWTDLEDNFQMDWEFDSAPNGNLALTGELDLVAACHGIPSQAAEFTLGMAFGDTRHAAINTLLQALGPHFKDSACRYLEQWERACKHHLPLTDVALDGGGLFHRSVSLLLAHEDKSYPGAMIASLSIPWGEVKGDEELGGYHLVWTRDLVNSACGLLAVGNGNTALRALIYLAASQRADGGFAQNFWVNGEPYWKGIQLDEVAFPIMLAWRLSHLRALREFDPYPMVRRAAAYLVTEGPVTPQERWEESRGYSPSTLAAHISGLVCAAAMALQRGEEALSAYLFEYADFLEQHIEAWTVTTQGSLLPDVPRHYIRIHPVPADAVIPDEDPNTSSLRIANRGPGQISLFPARDVVDAGFLELVRYGLRRPGDALIEDSLRVVDAVLRFTTPQGACWRRYNHDGYGQRADGGAFEGWGQGHCWPLLTGERGHYEFAAGRDVTPYLRTLEGFAHGVGLLPEQVWDRPDLPEHYLRCGGPTGAAMPLMWAHAEYLKLLRSVHDGAVFDRIPVVADRYLVADPRRRRWEVWKFNRQVTAVATGTTLRIQAGAAFALVWSDDEWSRVHEIASTDPGIGAYYVDLTAYPGQTAPFRFTFRWHDGERWEGRNFAVQVRPKQLQ
ncbi:MAG: glycoside hydrolase family 15 protein [Terriglobales bacterium]